MGRIISKSERRGRSRIIR